MRADAEGAAEFGESEAILRIFGERSVNAIAKLLHKSSCVAIWRSNIRAAAEAGAKSSKLGFARAAKKNHILLFRPARGARWAAINFRGANGEDETAVGGPQAIFYRFPAPRCLRVSPRVR